MLMIRKASQDDVDGIVKVMKDTGYIDYVYPKESFADVRKRISGSMQVKSYIVGIDSHSRKVVGYFIFDTIKSHLIDSPRKLNSGYAYHAGVGVHSSFRGKGIATRLTRKAFQLAKKSGFKGMYCDVGSDNVASLNLQTKCGFKEIARYNSLSRANGVLNVVFEKRF